MIEDIVQKLKAEIEKLNQVVRLLERRQRNRPGHHSGK